MGWEERDQQRRGQGTVLEARSRIIKAQVACLKMSKSESGPALVKDRPIGHRTSAESRAGHWLLVSED